MGGVWARLRAEVRSSLASTIALVLLIGLASGVVIGAAAGARRTQTAYPRFLEASHAGGILLSVAGTGLRGAYDEIGRLPEVARSGQAAGVKLARVNASGRADFTTQTVAGVDGRLGYTVHRPNIFSGRLPDPRVATEVFANRIFANRYHVRVGSRIAMAVFTQDPPDPAHVSPSDWQPVTLTIVGIGVTPEDVVPVAVDDSLPQLLLTPAYFHRYSGLNELDFDGMYVELKPGADPARFREEVQRIFIAHQTEVGGEVFFADLREHGSRAERAIAPQAVALYLFAALAALGALLALAQILSRQMFVHATDYATLRALGMDRAQLLAVQLLRVGGVAVAGALLGAGLAVATSGLMPIGPARLAEPSPGISANLAILGIGYLTTVLLLLATASIPAWRAASVPGGALGVAEALGADQPSRIAAWAARVGAPAPTSSGMRMALEPGRGRSAVPVRSALVGLGVATAAVAAAFTFGSNLTRFVSTPAAYGWGWDLAADAQFGSFPRKDAADLLNRTSGVAAYAGGNYGAIAIGDRRIPAVGLDQLRGSVFPTLIEGRPPAGPDEIVLGTTSLSRIHRSVGDTVRMSVNGQTRSMRIVGRAVFPTFGQGSFEPTDLGEGAALTAEAMPLQFALPGMDPRTNYNFVLIRYAPGANREEVTARLKDAIGKQCPLDQFCTIRQAEPPPDVAGYGRVRATPLLLAGLLGLLGVAMMAHALVTSVRRRRRDLAILKTLGFVRRQVASTVAWQATTLAGLALLVGLPLGIAAGRWTWSLFAGRMGIVSSPSVPLFWLLLGVPTMIVLANLVAAIPGRAAARTRPAVILRTE